MDKSEQVVEVQVDDRLCESPSAHRTFWLPHVLLDRLDKIIEQNGRAVAPLRGEVVGGLLLELEPTAERIEELVRAYRGALVKDCLLEPPTGTTVLADAPHKGRRPRGVAKIKTDK